MKSNFTYNNSKNILSDIQSVVTIPLSMDKSNLSHFGSINSNQTNYKKY